MFRAGDEATNSEKDDIKRIMIVGAGPIVIGQACEFDYLNAGVQVPSVRPRPIPPTAARAGDGTRINFPPFSGGRLFEARSVREISYLTRSFLSLLPSPQPPLSPSAPRGTR